MIQPDLTVDQPTGPGGPCLPRRAALLGAGAVGAAVVLAGCSTYGDDAAAPPASDPPAAPPANGSQGAPAAPAGGDVLAQTTDIPVGGGKIFANKSVVVTQPEKGTFLAFSTTCPHQGCKVTKVADGTINCPCHGSKFKVTDGSVDAGPSKQPLAAARVTVEGTAIKLG